MGTLFFFWGKYIPAIILAQMLFSSHMFIRIFKPDGFLLCESFRFILQLLAALVMICTLLFCLSQQFVPSVPCSSRTRPTLRTFPANQSFPSMDVSCTRQISFFSEALARLCQSTVTSSHSFCTVDIF